MPLLENQVGLPACDCSFDLLQCLSECRRASLKWVRNLPGGLWLPVPKEVDPASGTWNHAFAVHLLTPFHDQDEVRREGHFGGELAPTVA